MNSKKIWVSPQLERLGVDKTLEGTISGPPEGLFLGYDTQHGNEPVYGGSGAS